MTIGRPPSGSSFTVSSSRMESGSGGSALGVSTGMKGSPLGVGGASNASGLGVGHGTGAGGGIGGMARTISRGFSVGKTRTTSETSTGSGSGKGQTAAEILKQYGDKK